MVSIRICLIVLGAFCSSILFIPLKALSMPAEILLLRHAEKPPTGPELSEKGWQRARALTRVFHERSEILRFGPPAALYAMAPSTKGASVRAIQTLQFVAQDLKLPIIANVVRDDFETMLDEIRTTPAYDGKMVVICWEHDVLEDIAQSLGVAPKPKYPGKIFDRLWRVSFNPSGDAEFLNLPQRLLPDDSDQ